MIIRDSNRPRMPRLIREANALSDRVDHRRMIVAHCHRGVIRVRRGITLHPNSCLRITVTRFSTIAQLQASGSNHIVNGTVSINSVTGNRRKGGAEYHKVERVALGDRKRDLRKHQHPKEKQITLKLL